MAQGESDATPQSLGKLEPGRWEGEYIDVKGHRGRLSLDLATEGGVLRGKYELTFRTEDSPQIISGAIEGDVDERGGVRMRLALGGKDRQAGVTGEQKYEARLHSAGSYARQALFGSVGESSEGGFGGGVWIAWRFNRPAKEE